MRYQIYRDVAGQYRWRLIARNNEIVASGEGYTTKAKCLYAVSLLKDSSNAPVHDAA